MKRSLIKTITSFFALFCIIFIPYPFNITKAQLAVTNFIFGKLIGFIAENFFAKKLFSTKVYSDSISMYILVLVLFFIAIIISIALVQIKKWPLYKEKIFRIFYQLFIYYLALQLLKYGADKAFKNQFYLPEPNTLFTPIGMADKDLLYWSAMGTSYSYNLFLGSLEILSAILILIKRTSLLGLLLSAGILLNIVAVNFGFDISVKLFSLFLLFLNGYLLYPYRKRLYQLLFLKNRAYSNDEVAAINKTFLSSFLRWLVIGLICLEVFYPFVQYRNFNGDTAQRPFLHGAYEVTGIIVQTDTLPSFNSPVKRFFIHKDSYIIFQDQQDGMKDYKLGLDKPNSLFLLTDYKLQQTSLSFSYQSADSSLTLQYFINGKEATLLSKAIDWRKLPALKKSFHWTVDGIDK